MVTVTGVEPSVYVNVHGPVPTKVTVISTVVPLPGQITPVPAIVASGGGNELSTITTSASSVHPAASVTVTV